MLGDERRDRFGEAGFAREHQPIRHVRLDDLGRLKGLEAIVRIVPARLVLHEVLGVVDLADVVVVAADAAEEAIGPDAVARRLDEVRHGHRVRIGARRLE